MDVVISASTLGLLGGLVVLLTFLGRIPPWLGYPLGGGLLSFYVLILVVGLKASRDFKKRPPPSASIVGKRGVVVEVEDGWALAKIEGAYWRVYCSGCAPGDVVEVVRVGDVGVEARRVG
ncbi:MAG: NfeD family protein [Pyrobaculum sp.]|uniref:NfeD family protein n=1 Tax=Pyrobaculum sp. TaxID=2004705 RepID=UPI0031636876